MRRTTLLAAVLLVASATRVHAHPTDPTIVTRVDRVEPALDGVTVEVRAGAADQLLVVNGTRTPVEVLDASGEPFLRIGPDTVDANVTSPDWRRSNSPVGAGGNPTKARPRWATVARGSSWGWFDHRMHETPRTLTPELRNARTTVRLADWTVPLRHGATTATVRGHVEYRPVLGSFRTTVTIRPTDVEADALDGRVPALFLRWTGNGTLTLRGVGGEPFARLTSTGAEVNDASPTWQEDQRLRGNDVSGPADPTTPRWRRHGDTPQLTWLDRRLAYAPGFPPDDVARDTGETTLVEWEVPADLDGTPAALEGTTTWVPNALQATRDTARRWQALVFAGAAVAVVLVVLRRRTAR